VGEAFGTIKTPIVPVVILFVDLDNSLYLVLSCT